MDFPVSGEQHRPQRIRHVQRDTHPQLSGRRVFRRRPGEVQALHVRRWDSVPRAGEISQHGLSDVRQPVQKTPLGDPTGTRPRISQQAVATEVAV